MQLFLSDEEATEQLGKQLAVHAQAGDVLLLSGPLGAGKSCFSRAFIRQLMCAPRLGVPSPTFTLVQSYTTPAGVEISHYDLWRLDGPQALEELGWDEALAGIVLVEWPDRLGALTPPTAWQLEFALLDAGRMLEIKGDLRGFHGI